MRNQCVNGLRLQATLRQTGRWRFHGGPPLSAIPKLAAALRAQFPATPSTKASETGPVVTLSPFEVSADKDTGYAATSTLAGTRLNTPVKDLGASLSILTKDFITDVGATSIEDLLIFTAGMEAAGPGGNFSGSGGDINSNQTVGENARINPQGATRTRGLDAPNFTRGFFASGIPMDAYNTEKVAVVGWRRDEDYFTNQAITFVPNPNDPNDPGQVHYGFCDFSFPRTPPRMATGETKSTSAVLKWPQRLWRLPAGSDFSVFYNSSGNFSPAGSRVNT